MRLFRFLALPICLLILANLAFTQEDVDKKSIRPADLSKTIDRLEADAYLNGVDAEIEKLVKDYQQLSKWDSEITGTSWSDMGKTRTADSIRYGLGLKESKSDKYLDRFGQRSLYIRIKIETPWTFAHMSGAGVGSVAHGLSVAGGCLIAQITSANPKSKELEKKLTDIILNQAMDKPCY